MASRHSQTDARRRRERTSRWWFASEISVALAQQGRCGTYRGQGPTVAAPVLPSASAQAFRGTRPRFVEPGVRGGPVAVAQPTDFRVCQSACLY